MMIAFIVVLLLSYWKIYAFLPKKALADDDTTSESIDELTEVMVLCIIDIYEKEEHEFSPLLLYEHMINHSRFDKEHFWRFNQNKLNHLIANYYVGNPQLSTFQEICEAEKK